MVRKIKISSVYTEPEPTNEANEPEQSSDCSPKGEEQASDEDNALQTNEVDQQIEPITETNEANDEMQPKPNDDDEVAEKPKPNKYLDMPTTSKILQQVSCQACGKRCQLRYYDIVTRNTAQPGNGRNSQRPSQYLRWKSRTAKN